MEIAEVMVVCAVAAMIMEGEVITTKTDQFTGVGHRGKISYATARIRLECAIDNGFE